MHMSIPCTSRPGRAGRIARHGGPLATLPKRMTRGKEYVTPTGVRGVYVGTMPDGSHVFAFSGGTNFTELCIDFDSISGKSRYQQDWQRKRRAAAVA